MIGDSIRMGYDKYVKKHLKDSCEVYYPDDNCRFAQYLYRHLHDWKDWLNLSDDIDLVHWNVGLWDTLILGDEGCLTPPEMYACFIERICIRIKKLFPKAKVVFATSTPVIEERFDKNFIYRLNKDVEKYNEIAVEICKKHSFVINDLYPVLKAVPEEYYIDAAHPYTKEGTTITTNAVCKAICEELRVEYKEFIPDSEDAAIIQKRIDEVLGI